MRCPQPRGWGAGGLGLTQDQSGPAGDAGLQTLVEDLVKEHDGLAGRESQGEVGPGSACPWGALPQGTQLWARGDPSIKLLSQMQPAMNPSAR